MFNEPLRYTLIFLVTAVIQVLICNHIHLFHFATPLIYVYLVLAMRRGTARWGILLWGFSMGLLMDTFTNTPGVAAGSMTFIALLQPMILERMLLHEEEENILPSMITLGKKQYVYYTLIMTGIYCAVFYTLEMLSFFNFWMWLACVVGSSLLTSALILTVENVRKKKD